MVELFKNINPIKPNVKTKNYRYTIINLNTNLIDISVFTEKEWTQLETINKCFSQMQHEKLDNLNNLEQEKINWFDTQLKNQFGVKFANIDWDCGDELDINSNIKILSKANQIETNKLRKWFIDNYIKLEQYYGEITEFT